MHGKLVSLSIVAAMLAATPAPAADPIFKRWETLGREHGLPSRKVFAVAVDGPRVWAGTDNGLALLDQGKIKVFGTAAGLPSPAVTALAVDPGSGDVWIGTMGGLARFSGGRIDAYTQLDSGLVNNVVYGVAVNGTEVWVATAAGLNRYDSRLGVWEVFDTTNTLMHEPWCYALTIRDDVVYTAVWGGGVLVRDPKTGAFRAHRDPDGEMEIDLFRDDGLVHDVTSSISSDSDILWVGTYFGLSRYDGRRWRSFSEDDSGLAGDFINFVKAGGDVVWIGTDQGLSRFDSSTWHTWRRDEDGDGYTLEITGPDGETATTSLVAGPTSNTIYGIDLAGDDVWLATAEGLTHAVAAAPAASRAGGSIPKGDTE